MCFPVYSIFVSLFLFLANTIEVGIMDTYIRKKIFASAILLLVIGGLNIGFATLFKKDIVASLFGKNSLLTNGLFLLIALSALAIGLYRDSYLPFLGPSVMPCALLNPQIPAGADFEITVSLRPGSKVLYWAAEPANHDLQFAQNWKLAYNEYTNAGVAIADGQGLALLKVRKPQAYTVPIKGVLEPHIHYRVCTDHGWIGPVRTVTFDGKEYFENVVAAQEKPEPIANPPPAPAIPPPASAMDSMNTVAKETLRNSVMAKSGALEEFRPPSMGASLDHAFAYKEVAAI